MNRDAQETLLNIGGILFVIFISVAISAGIRGAQSRDHLDALVTFCESGADGIDISIRDQICPQVQITEGEE